MNGLARPRKDRWRPGTARRRRRDDPLPTFAQTRALREAFRTFEARYGRKVGLRHAIRRQNELGLRRARQARRAAGEVVEKAARSEGREMEMATPAPCRRRARLRGRRKWEARRKHGATQVRPARVSAAPVAFDRELASWDAPIATLTAILARLETQVAAFTKELDAFTRQYAAFTGEFAVVSY